jgi:hypothetical protein
MAFKMKGSPAKMGMIKGTAGHRSALKAMEEKAAMKAMEKAAAMKAMKKDSPADFNAKLKQASADGKLSGKFKEAVDASPAKFGPGKEVEDKVTKRRNRLKDLKERFPREKAAKTATKSPGKAMEKSPMKEKALPTYNQAWDKMSEEKKKSFKSKEDFVSQAKAYNEKKYGTTNPSKDSQKAGQTRKELAGAHKKTTTTKVKTVKRDGEDVTVKKGAGANRGKTLTATQKSKERLKIDQANKRIKDAKKSGDKDARDKAQLEKAEIKAGRDDKYTGTMLSRAIARAKVRRNKRQLERRAKKNKE